MVVLSWSGATTPQVDTFRSGTRIATAANTGTHTDVPKNGANVSYKVCEAGSTTICSDDIAVVF